MALKNQWVSYLDRGYKNIKSSILNRMKVLVPEMTDHSESNLFVIIVSIFAGISEVLNYYIDNAARELYLSTARRYSSLIKITRLIDYRVRAKIAATTDIKITAVDSNGNPVNLINNFTFNANLVVKDSSGIEFITTRKVTMWANTSTVTVGAKQSKQVVNRSLGTTTTEERQSFKLADDYEHDSLQITINGNTWELRQTLAFSGPLDRHFIVEVNESKEAWVVFGDNVNGTIPPASQTVYATYYETKGKNGILDVNTINTLVTVVNTPNQVPAITSFKVTNPISASGGVNEEDIERIRRHAPLSLRTLDRAVTKQDHIDIAELVPGVGKADVMVDFKSKKIILYVAPDEGGTASDALLTRVEDEFKIKGLMGPVIEARAAGQTILRIKVTVTAKFRRDATETEKDIVTALINGFGFNNSTVNRKIRQSDIIALIDGLDKVDYLILDELTTKPYPRILKGDNSLESNYRIKVNAANTEIIKWRVAVLSGSNQANVYRTGPTGGEMKDGVITIHATDPGATDYETSGKEVSLAIWGNFLTGDSWIFYSYPYNKDIELIDYTIPTIDVNELDIIVNEQLIPNS